MTRNMLNMQKYCTSPLPSRQQFEALEVTVWCKNRTINFVYNTAYFYQRWTISLFYIG